MLLLITKEDNYLDGADCSGQTVLLDAMASGLPVIASHKSTISDYAKDTEDIILVDFYDTASIKDKINLLKDKSLRENLARNARRKVEEELSTKQMARGLSDVFLGLY